MPSVEAKLLQALSIQDNEDILLVGSGSGYLSSCVSLLGNRVHAIDIDNNFIEASKKNSNYDFLKRNILYECMDIMNNLSIIGKYKVIVFTSSIDNLDLITDYMNNQSRAFVFIGKELEPFKRGMLITKSKSGSLIPQKITLSLRIIFRCYLKHQNVDFLSCPNGGYCAIDLVESFRMV